MPEASGRELPWMQRLSCTQSLTSSYANSESLSELSEMLPGDRGILIIEPPLIFGVRAGCVSVHLTALNGGRECIRKIATVMLLGPVQPSLFQIRRAASTARRASQIHYRKLRETARLSKRPQLRHPQTRYWLALHGRA